jgi:hypothetical protein
MARARTALCPDPAHGLGSRAPSGSQSLTSSVSPRRQGRKSTRRTMPRRARRVKWHFQVAKTAVRNRRAWAPDLRSVLGAVGATEHFRFFRSPRPAGASSLPKSSFARPVLRPRQRQYRLARAAGDTADRRSAGEGPRARNAGPVLEALSPLTRRKILFFPLRTSAIISAHEDYLRCRVCAHVLARVRVCSSRKSARTGGGPRAQSSGPGAQAGAGGRGPGRSRG